MPALQVHRLLTLWLLTGLLVACSTPAATLTPSPTPAPRPSAAATTPTPPRPTSQATSAPTTPALATPTIEGPSTGDDPGAPLPWLVYQREDGLYATNDRAGPPQLLAPLEAGQQALPWAAAPDGSALAFVRAQGLDAPPEAAGEASIALYMIGAGISGERKLLDLLPPEGADMTPGEEASMGLLPALTASQQLVWSPDSGTVVVASAHEGQVDLYAVAADGGATRLTTTPEIETLPAWSTDGTFVAAATVTSFGTGAGWSDIGLAVVRGDGSGEALVQNPLQTDGGILAISDLIWIDDATLVAAMPGFFGPGEVRSIEVTGGAEATIFQGNLAGVAWSPYADALAITAAGYEQAGETTPGLYLWRPGEQAAQLVDAGDASQPPVWSPTGEWVAYSVEGDGAGVRLAPMDPERGPRPITSTPSFAIVWSPDGKLLATGGELWHLNGSPVDPLPGFDATPLAWAEGGLYILSRDEPTGEQILRLWTEMDVVELDRGVSPFDARIATLQLPPAKRLDAAGLLPLSYRAEEGAADGFSIIELDPASGAEREVGVVPYEPGGITRIWSILPSPDGSKLAVAASGADPATLLYLIEGGQTRLLSDAAADNWPESWSPDGARLLVISTRGATEDCGLYTCAYDIYSIEVATGAEAQLNATEATEERALWSPVGDRIAFTRGCSERGNESCGPSLYVMAADGGDEVLLAEGWVGEIAFAPDGQRIAYTQSVDGLTDIYTVAAAGGEPQLLAGEAEVSELGPRWSPDGRTLAFTRVVGICQVERCSEAVYVVAAEGGAPLLVRQLGERGGLLFSGWSADGRLLLALREADDRAWLLAYSADGAALGAARVTIPVRITE
jgi:Tol biopolymer transport system component